MAGGRTTRGSPEGVEVGSSRHGARSFASYAPTDAGWSLDDYAYDPVAGEVVSRDKIARRGQGATNAAGEAGAGAGASGGSEPENRREGSKRARRPPKRAEDFERDAPIAAKAGHVGATDTAGGESQRGGVSLDSDVASHDQRSGGASLASAPGSDGPNSSALVAHAVGIRRCPVDGCAASCFPSSKRRIERVLCQAHVGALSCLVDGVPRRFCQVCYVLHGVDAFKGKNKTCTAVLQRKKLLRAQAMESRAPRESGAKSGGSSGGSGDGSVHGLSNGSLTQFHQAAETNRGGRTPRGGTGASGGGKRVGASGGKRTGASGGSKRKASNGTGRRTSAADGSGESSGGSGGASGGGSGGSVVVPTTVAARPSKKKSTMLTPPAAAADVEAKKRLSKGKSTQSDDSDPSDDPDSPAFDPWGVKTAVSPAHNTHPSLVGHHTHHATHGDTNGGFFQNLWHGIGSVGSGGWHAQRDREELERSLLRDMEHGALSSLVVPSAAIKVPNLTPEVFIARRHEQHVIHHHHHHHHQHRGSTSNPANVAQHGAGGDESHLLPPPAAAPAARGAVDLGHSPIPPPGFTNCVDSDWLGFFNDNNKVPGGAHVDAVEDDGYDVFIRPGSLIFGVHSQSAVPGVSQGAAEMLRTAAEHAGDDGVITRAVTRSRTRSQSRSGAANTGSGGGLHAHGDSNTDTSNGSRGFDGSYDASGPDGLLRIPEGVFGSFNGEICKLEHDPVTGEVSTVPVRGAPEGLHPNALTAEESVLDTGSSTARLTLPVNLDRSLAFVCMFRGAHLPTTIVRRGKRDTEVEICFAPKGGFRAAETWRTSGGRRVAPETDTSDGSGEDVPSRCLGDLEGTATLEAIIAEGNMRGLPVGAAIPLLLTPDRELREEVVDAMSRLEFSRTAPAGGASPARTDSDGTTTDSETTHEGDEDDAPQMPPPVALLSMLGAVLAARAVGLEANPRLERGAAAMARYFCLEHTAARIGCASPAGMFKYGMRYHPGRIGVGAYHDGGLLRGLFNALTAVIAALWHVRLVGFSCVVLAATVKTAMKIIGDGVVGGVPSLTGDIALSPAFLASVASASVPAVLYREALRFDAEGMDEGNSGIKRGSSKRWSTAHAKHAVRAQNRGAMIWPFVAIACVAVQLLKLRSDASGLNTAKLLLVAATEIVPAATLLASLQFPEWNTRSKRRANWPALSVTVHIARMVACLARGHTAYASRYSMYLGFCVDVVTSTLSVAMFPMWRTADAVQAQTGVVACDWIGHYLRTGTTPAYLVPGDAPLTPVEIWCHVVRECVWRVLTPAAVNALVMHRVVQSGRSKRRATVVEDAHSE